MPPQTATHLLIRADASSHIGSGHVMRCLALAQAWQERGGRTTFAMALSAPPLEQRLHTEGMAIAHLSVQPGSSTDAVQTIAAAHEAGATWVVADGYQFGTVYQQALKDTGLRLLVVDDYGHADHYVADIVLNQNIHAYERLYSNREPYTRLLLGTRYGILRREFWSWRSWERQIPPTARKVLVTMGGADPDNVTLKVIHALQQGATADLEVVVVVGSSNIHYDELQTASRASLLPLRLVRNVTDMPDLMAWADVAITAAGSTSWECCLMGLPGLTLILAENQQPVAEALHTQGVMQNLGWHANVSADTIIQALTMLLTSSKRRTAMAQRGREFVDGAGGERIIRHMASIALKLREAQEHDCRLLWEWANEPDVRAFSLSPQPIPWHDHMAWFQATLGNPERLLSIATDASGIPVGQVRFDIEGSKATISISIAPQFRGKGYGSMLIWLGAQHIFDTHPITIVHAYVKPQNQASLRAFNSAGFSDTGVTTLRGYQVHHLVLPRHATAPQLK